MLPFCRPSKDLPKAFCGKKSWQAHQNDLVQTQGQAQERTRTARRHFKNKKKTNKDKLRTDLAQAKDKKRTFEGQPLRESAILPNILRAHARLRTILD